MASLMREIAAEAGAGASTSDGNQTDEEKAKEKVFRKAWEDMLVDGMNGALDIDELGKGGAGKEEKGGSEIKDDNFQSSIRKAMEKLKESEESIKVCPFLLLPCIFLCLMLTLGCDRQSHPPVQAVRTL